MSLTLPSLLSAVAQSVPWMQDRAETLDRDAAFPDQEIERLHRLGALTMPLPVQGNGRNETLADALAALLVLAGQGNLSVECVLEAHVNTMHLVARYGTEAQRREVDAAARDGCLFGLWVTDPPQGGLRMTRAGGRVLLCGAKRFCSSAGHAGGALVTAQDDDGDTRMLVLRLAIGERISPLPAPLQGMRASTAGAVDFTGCEVAASAILGAPGDYLRSLISRPAPGAVRRWRWAG